MHYMRTTHFQKNLNPINAAIVLLAVGLSACGGGGTDGSGSGSNEQASNAQPIQTAQSKQSLTTNAAPEALSLAAETPSTPQEANVANLPTGYVRCAGEAQNTNCQFTGNTTMYYGVPGAFAVGNVNGPFNCNTGNAVFGDPIFGTVKSCYIPQSTLPPGTTNPTTPNTVPAGHVACADEAKSTTCQFTGSVLMYYGANGRFASSTVQGPFNCAKGNSVFGDPIYGVVKTCYIPQSAVVGSGGGGTPPPPPPAPVSSAKIAGIELAQSLLVPSSDTSLPLIANKAVLVKVNVTTSNPQEAKPTAVLQVQNGAGQVLQQLPLTTPTSALPSAVPAVPSLADSYTVVVPANLVGAGVRFVASLSNNTPSSMAIPKVAGGLPMKFVTIPVQIGGTVAQVPEKTDSYVLARMPVSSIVLQNHAIYVAKSVSTYPSQESAWGPAYSNILAEINNLHYLEQASNQTYYYGFLPKRTYGLAGLGYVPGNTAVGFDLPSNPELARQVMTHELGHNFNLEHAPCGGPQDADPQFPYANAQLGGTGRYLWGYNFATNTFVDPTNVNRHDIMSYCQGDTFSDYNYRLMQNFLVASNGLAKPTAAANLSEGPQELLLVSGKVESEKAELSPTKSLLGTAEPPKDGPYTLRVVTAQGTLEYRFEVQKLDHEALAQHFAFTIPHPGLIGSMTVVKGATSLVQTQTKPASMARALNVASDKPQVQQNEKNGVLSLTWDHTKYPYLSVTHVAPAPTATRSTLAQDLSGGTASLPLKGLSDAGAFEFSLSDGLNTARLVQAR
jgi:hypothetical protein